MPSRAPKHVIATLRSLKRYASFEDAGFGTIDGTVMHNGVETTTDAFVKAKTEIYMDSWVRPRIQRLLDWAEGK